MASAISGLHRPEEIVESSLAASIQPYEPRKVAASVTISISPEPDAFEVIKIAALLPNLAVSFWTLGAMQRSLRSFGR